MSHRDKDAIVNALAEYRKVYNGRIPRFVIDQMSQFHGVGKRTLWRWASEAVEQVEEEPDAQKEDRPQRGGFEITEEHLVVVRATLNVKEAHGLLFPDRDVEGWVSYPTFSRAFKNLPPSIRDGILNGWDAMSKRQVYLPLTAPHKNHTWHLDHTQADVWVSLPGSKQIIRPWVSAVRDSATSAILAATAYEGRPNEDSICDLLATAALPHEYETPEGTVTVGGLCVQVALDNAAEHFAEAVTRGLMLLGVVQSPTRAYYKHQNGPAENIFSTLNKQLFKGLPGYTKGGASDDGDNLIVPHRPDKVDPETVLTFESFQKHLDAWVIRKNTDSRLRRLGNQSPLMAWLRDPTEVRWVPEVTMRAMMLRASFDRAVNAEGIRFRGVDYLAPELNWYREKGLKLGVRYLTRETRWIEVFDGDEWVCRAFDRDLLTDQQRNIILRNRARDLDLLKRLNADANLDRRHRGMTDEGSAYDGEDIPSEAQDAVGDALGEVVDISKKRESKSHQTPNPGPLPEDMTRVDPTTPQRSKRQIAPSREAAREKKKEDKAAESRQRMQHRPGSNFGGIND